MTIRRKKGRIVPTAAPTARAHGRLAVVMPSTPRGPDVRASVVAYMSARIRQQLHDARGDARQARNERRRAERASSRIAALPGGRDELAVANRATAPASIGSGLRIAARSLPDSDAERFGIEAAESVALFVHDRRASDPMAIRLLRNAAEGFALRDLLITRAMAAGPSVLSASRSRLDGEARTTATLAAFGDLVKLATSVGVAARGDMMSGLALEAQSRSDRGQTVDPTVQARIDAFMASRHTLARSTAPEPAGSVQPLMAPDVRPDDDDDAQSIVAAAMDDQGDEPPESSGDTASSWNPGSPDGIDCELRRIAEMEAGRAAR